MKYTFIQTIQRVVFAGLILPGIATPIDATQVAKLAEQVIPKPVIQVQEASKTEIPLKFDPNSITPVIGVEKEVKIVRGTSRFDASRRAKFEAHIDKITEPSFEKKRALVKEVAEEKGIDPKILEAVWQVESGKAYNTRVRSSAGAQGPAQFMPGTWNKYKADGNGDGVADVHNAEDALPAAANLLIANGLKDGDVRGALFAYNHANWYVDKVLHVAKSIE